VASFLTTQTSSVAAMMGLVDRIRERPGGSIVNEGDVRNINGFAIDVSGINTRWEKTTEAAIQPGKGVRTFTPETAAALLAPDALSSSLKTQDVAFTRQQLDAVRERGVEGTALEGLAIAATATVIHTESVPVEQVQGIGVYDRAVTSRADDIAYIGERLARSGELAGIERRLSAEYGEAVKVAWDPVAGEYLMLRKGQPGYEQVRSAQEVFDTDVNRTLRRMGYSPETFRGVLTRYGVTV